MANSMGHHTSSPASHYSLFAKILHWGFVLLFAYGIATQINEADDLNDAAVFFDEILFASLFLLLLIIRFAYMNLTHKKQHCQMRHLPFRKRRQNMCIWRCI